MPSNLTEGYTYLIPKCENNDASQLRPITCLSNFYKLTTKTLTRSLQSYVEANNLLSMNQLGSVRKVQGAKEQTLFNKVIYIIYT